MPEFKAHYFGGKIDAAMPEPIFHNSFAEAAGVAKHAWEAAQNDGEAPRSIRVTNRHSGEEVVFEFARVTALEPGASLEGDKEPVVKT